jgi:uncharacterized protein YcfJ
MKKTNNPEDALETIGEAALRLLQGMEARCGRPLEEKTRQGSASVVRVTLAGVIRLNLGGGQGRNWETDAGYVRVHFAANDAVAAWAFEDETITLDDYDW